MVQIGSDTFRIDSAGTEGDASSRRFYQPGYNRLLTLSHVANLQQPHLNSNVGSLRNLGSQDRTYFEYNDPDGGGTPGQVSSSIVSWGGGLLVSFLARFRVTYTDCYDDGDGGEDCDDYDYYDFLAPTTVYSGTDPSSALPTPLHTFGSHRGTNFRIGAGWFSVVRIGATDRLCFVQGNPNNANGEFNNKIWLAGATRNVTTLTTASHVLEEQRGTMAWPSNWNWGSSNPADGNATKMADIVNIVGFGSDLLILRRDGGLWRAVLGTSGSTADVTPTLLGTFSGTPRWIGIIDGTPWILQTDGKLVCVEISGSSVTWTQAAAENNHPNVPWNTQRDGAWRILATQASGEYPGSETSPDSLPDTGDHLLVHTATDGDQELYYYEGGSVRAWERDGEGAHSGAPVRFVPRSAVLKLPQEVPDHPNPTRTGDSAIEQLYLRQHPDGTLQWSHNYRSCQATI